jgi:hypothetical protein
MNLNFSISNKYYGLVFIFILLSVFFFLDFGNILFNAPKGIHFIRQTDCLSFADNYLRNNMRFFEPQVYNLTSIDGKAACEFPILYYLTASLYKIFGEHAWILRLLNVVVVSIGLYFLFKLLYLFINDLLYSLVFTFLFFSSTVLIYYSNNFLPDAPALGFTFIAWYFFYLYFQNKLRRVPAYLSCFFFTLAALIKVTYFINPLAAFLSLLIINKSEKKSYKFMIRGNNYFFLAFLLSVIVVFSWNLFVFNYNRSNNDTYFLIHARPIWETSFNEIGIVWDHITNYWYSKYYYQSTIHVFAAITLAGLIFIRKSVKSILIPAILLLLGSICNFLLFYIQFKYHDYYFIALIPAIIFSVISSFIALRRKFPKIFNHPIPRIALLVLCFLSLNFARQKLKDRYSNKTDQYATIGEKLEGARNYLKDFGINENDTFVIMTDLTPNGGLFTIGHKGWNVPDTSVQSTEKLQEYIKLGADYIIITDEGYLHNPEISSLIGNKVGAFNEVAVYQLKGN